MIKKYRVKWDTQFHKAGEIVYTCKGYDYDCASDDTRWTGIEHTSVSHDADGGYPFLTIPKSALEEV
jgi:hypothetical protein